jgi:hypothetical protein
MSDENGDNKNLMPALPITWRTPDPSDPNKMKEVGRTNAMIAAPTAQEVRQFSDWRAKTCASCRFFRAPDTDKGAKDRPAIRGFVALAVIEAKWKKRFLVDDPAKLGRCDQKTEVAVGPSSGACDMHQERRR